MIPLEHDEAKALSQWLGINKILFTHVANERKASPQAIKRLASIGMSAGYPDYTIYLPNKLLNIELKRQKSAKPRVQPSQKQWIEDINKFGYAEARVCYGAREAIEFVRGFM